MKAAFTIIKLLYPLMIFGSFSLLGFKVTVLLVLLLLAGAMIVAAMKKEAWQALLLAGLTVILYFSADLYQSILIKSVPALASLWYCSLFFRSLFAEKTLIAEFASLKKPDLGSVELRYCFYVTILWTVFTGLNAVSIFLIIAFMSDYYWALYSGVIAYLLVAGLFALEFAFRTLIFKPLVAGEKT